MIVIRNAGDIFQAHGEIKNGTFSGRWHFSFDQYYDPGNTHFGTLRVFNDDTLSPGAIWPLHSHRDIEVVTYCAEGEFRHEDEQGLGGILRKGWVQHTTVGSGMYHSEINNQKDKPMRFIQMWFIPSRKGLNPSVELKKVTKKERTNRLLPLVSNEDEKSLKIFSNAKVYSCFIEKDKKIASAFKANEEAYLYLLEGGPVEINGNTVSVLDAAKMINEKNLMIKARKSAEFLLIVVF